MSEELRQIVQWWKTKNAFKRDLFDDEKKAARMITREWQRRQRDHDGN